MGRRSRRDAGQGHGGIAQLVIVDSSAWIDFFRGNDQHGKVRAAIEDDAVDLMTTDVIRLEILAGADHDSLRTRMNSLLAGCTDAAQIPRADVDDAVALFQQCRKRGETVRSPNDCLIAAIAVRLNVPVMHADQDFEVMKRHTRLRTVPLR